MPREAQLFEKAGGSPLEGYFMLKASGGNIPRSWIKNAKSSRKKREAAVAQALRKAKWKDIATLRDWEQVYRKECFYSGILILLELEREGESKR